MDTDDLCQVILVLLARLSAHLRDRRAHRRVLDPVPGDIYPNLSLLEVEGLITMPVGEGCKLATLTGAGHAEVEQNHDEWARILAD